MTTLVDETMESYVYPSYNSSYSYRYQPPKGKGGAGGPPWRPRGGGGGYFSGYGEGGAAAMAAAAAAAEYFDNYQRAQLKAILSQVNPNLTPRLRKANTKEVGVQVNPRQDASVQCSLGPRPLLLRRRGGGGAGAGAGAGAEHHEHGSSVSGAAARGVRFPRTIAVYSPVASRRLLTTFAEEEEEEDEDEDEEEQRRQQQRQQPEPPPRGVVVEAAGAGEKQPQTAAPPQPAAGEAGAEAEQDKAQQQPRGQAVEEPGKQAAESGGAQQVAAAPPPQDEGGQGKARVRFQFLEQKYGYYHCKDCNIRWESAYVWCVQGTNKVYFRQFCRTCQKSYNPYRVEDITCQSCKQTRCTCPVKLRHVDPKRPHRQDLCGRCKGKRLSCDSTFSFKYII